MPKLIMVTGLPGSGKSTWARSQTGYVRVNRDDIREKLATTGWVWSPENEKDVLRRRDEIIDVALKQGHSVISDDTNFGRKHKVRLEQLARESGAEFEIKRMDVPLSTCLLQNAQREGKARVPDEAIHKMYQQFVRDDPDHWPNSAPRIIQVVEPVVMDEHLMPAIICDLDGTLSLFKDKGHRGPYDATRCDEDEVNRPVKRLLEIYYRFMGYQIIYLSGREDRFRAPTERFFLKHHCPPGPLHMRATNDTRKDSIVKRELFDAHVRGRYNVEFVLDDRNQVVSMWRSLGLTVFQVADGDF